MIHSLFYIFPYTSNIPKKPAQQGEIQYEEAPVQGETYVFDHTTNSKNEGFSSEHMIFIIFQAI